MKNKSNRQPESPFSFIPSLLVALLIAFVFRTTAVQAFNIPSGSATPTLLTGDYVFVSMFSYGYSRYSLPMAPARPHGRIFAAMPKRGDTAVFVNPKNDVTLLKRIVGLPGDRIQVIKGVLVINGVPSRRERLPDYREKEWDPNYGPREILRRHYRETLPNGVTHEILGTEVSRREDSGPVDNTEVYVVPDGHFFAMGDNRDDSADSRYLDELGYVPLESLIGRAELRFVSLEPGAHLYEFWRWPQTLPRQPLFRAGSLTDRERGVVELQRALGHQFRNAELLAQAVTHVGAGHGRPDSIDNERLEFLGDRVLGLVIAQLLIERFPDANEGQLGPRLAALVRREALAEIAQTMNLGRYLVLAPGDVATGGRENAKLQADACEALIAALYLDGGLDAVRRFIERAWAPLFDDVSAMPVEPKTMLQEWAQGRGKNLPAYRVVRTQGQAHNPMFEVEVAVDGVTPVSATGPSKRVAEKAAALRLLQELGVVPA